MPRLTVEAALRHKDLVFVDVRSPQEFSYSHIPGAKNWPILDNEAREAVGTIYKTMGREKAIETGIQHVKEKLPNFYSEITALSQRYNHVLLYCSRGGMRSGTLYAFGESLGLDNLYLLEGGYKAYRQHVLSNTEELLKNKDFVVIHGRTGVGKTAILKALKAGGLPVMDLEDLAKNAGSVFGQIPYQEKPPSQKMFENLVYHELSTLGPMVFMESESKRIGQVSLSETFMETMVRGRHILVETTLKNRVAVIADLYLEKIKKDQLKKALEHLRKRLGHKKVDEMIQWIEEGSFERVIETLIVDYYDPLYDHSIQKYPDYVMRLDYQHIREAVGEITKFYQEVVNG
ncbi:MAG: hypothetical protein AVO33_10580 [delta proteobacterium ML8_F1]|nr:MAG: hypothetical protein AVO33_10580 [delta proteobacterium ML8_F1]